MEVKPEEKKEPSQWVKFNEDNPGDLATFTGTKVFVKFLEVCEERLAYYESILESSRDNVDILRAQGRVNVYKSQVHFLKHIENIVMGRENVV
jgi:hypothetical protein